MLNPRVGRGVGFSECKSRSVLCVKLRASADRALRPCSHHCPLYNLVSTAVSYRQQRTHHHLSVRAIHLSATKSRHRYCLAQSAPQTCVVGTRSFICTRTGLNNLAHARSTVCQSQSSHCWTEPQLRNTHLLAPLNRSTVLGLFKHNRQRLAPCLNP